MMNDSTFFVSSDTSLSNASAVSDTTVHVASVDSSNIIIDSFFQQSIQEINPILSHSADYSWFIYLLFFLMFTVALIWYLIPERLIYAFSISVKPDSARLNEKESPAPGAVVTFFFLMNSLITFSFLLYYVLKYMYRYDFEGRNYWEAMFYIAAVLSSVYALKMIMVILAGWVFDTFEMAKKQVRIYFNSNIAMGVTLLPLLFILVIVPNIYLLYLIIFITTIVFIIRWVQVVRLGISITHFNFFHLILYLCTLEIIPVLVLIKIFM
jgi:hypothetical protein